jgi:hypothetical protein
MCMERHTGGQTYRQPGRHTDTQACTMKLTATFHSFANMAKKAESVTREFFRSPVLLTFCPECINL